MFALLDMRLMMQGLTDAAFEQRFGAEDACLAALAAARQAAGMACPRCGNPKSYVYGRRVGCTRCNQRWSVTSGTVMARYQTAADPLVPRDAPDDEHQAGNLGDRTRPPAGRVLPDRVVSA